MIKNGNSMLVNSFISFKIEFYYLYMPTGYSSYNSANSELFKKKFRVWPNLE